MTGTVDVVLVVAAVVAAVGTLGGAAWWLTWPRIEDRLQAVVRSVGNVHDQLDADRPDTTGWHARAAAEQLPELREAVQHLAAGHSRHEERLAGTERRLGSVEQALIALLGRELRDRLVDDLVDDKDPTPTESDTLS